MQIHVYDSVLYDQTHTVLVDTVLRVICTVDNMQHYSYYWTLSPFFIQAIK